MARVYASSFQSVLAPGEEVAWYAEEKSINLPAVRRNLRLIIAVILGCFAMTLILIVRISTLSSQLSNLLVVVEWILFWAKVTLIGFMGTLFLLVAAGYVQFINLMAMKLREWYPEETLLRYEQFTVITSLHVFKKSNDIIKRWVVSQRKTKFSFRRLYDKILALDQGITIAPIPVPGIISVHADVEVFNVNAIAHVQTVQLRKDKRGQMQVGILLTFAGAGFPPEPDHAAAFLLIDNTSADIEKALEILRALCPSVSVDDVPFEGLPPSVRFKPLETPFPGEESEQTPEERPETTGAGLRVA